MKETRIPTLADLPPRLLLWSADDIMPVIIGFCFGILVNQIVICTVLGLVSVHFYKKFRDMHADGFIFHLAYWYGCSMFRSSSMINPWVKRLIP